MSQFWKRIVRPGVGSTSLVPKRGIVFGAKTDQGQGQGQAKGSDIWKRLTFLVAAPAICLCMVNVFAFRNGEQKRQPFVKYEHLRRRTKRFPWGDGEKSFFHNRETNALPDGYEN
ncbi:cytochrome c oxidase subunit 6A2, mitochondrial [Scaptodrosophila lebanonensis]|uniref:Cytochrome c oxidase subunit 6A2, mitochondrial n=1 Tax=Drosophila lebanonensis TaxID=7225 RepID=A0A6J2UHP9_DROLE|nr:cytochrome c oxidase subunit 6A2, mitochondrial [Scaptodrosophila lebanonensis]